MLWDFLSRRNAAINRLAKSLDEHSDRIGALIAQTKGSANGEKLAASLQCNSEVISGFSQRLERAASCPIPVQTFPTTDNLEWDSEKHRTAKVATAALIPMQQKALAELTAAHTQVETKLYKFFSALDKYGTKVDRSNNHTLHEALDGLFACSPKRVVANFQRLSLECGWAYVSLLNQIVDTFAKTFSRCRAGIFNARLNYADVLQISEEVLTTLRTTSTVLEDVQRRYDILDGLQNQLKSDLQSAEIVRIFEAIKGSFTDTLETGSEGLLTNILSKPAGAMAAALSIAALPSAQFQGQLAREQRIRLFVATAALVRSGWGEWTKLKTEIVEPNLKIMFGLKNDFLANRILCLCDLVTMNGYSLKDFSKQIEKRFLGLIA